MATIVHPLVNALVPAPGQIIPLNQADTGIALSLAQTGNADSTNIIDRGGIDGPAIIVVSNVGGATPTVTINILGSADGANYRNQPYATAAAPQTPVVSAITVTTSATNHYMVTGSWRFLKLNYSANTNETITATIFLFPDLFPALAL